MPISFNVGNRMDETRCDTIREEFAATLRTEKGRVVSRRGYRKCALLPVEYRAPERRSITRVKPGYAKTLLTRILI